MRFARRGRLPDLSLFVRVKQPILMMAKDTFSASDVKFHAYDANEESWSNERIATIEEVHGDGEWRVVAKSAMSSLQIT